MNRLSNNFVKTHRLWMVSESVREIRLVFHVTKRWSELDHNRMEKKLVAIIREGKCWSKYLQISCPKHTAQFEKLIIRIWSRPSGSSDMVFLGATHIIR
jgi:hypothetical protein